MFEKLIEIVGDNEEALKVINDAKATQETLTQKLNTYEVDAKKAFEKRDEFKSQLGLVKSKLGLEDLNEEALDKVLKSKGGDDAELNNLKGLIEKANQEKTQIEESYKSKLSQFALKTELQKTGLAQKAIDETAYGVLESIALQGASYENDSIVFKNEDGSTKYVNGAPMTLKDKVNELYNTSSFAGLFKADGKGGTGSNPQGGKSGAAAGTKKRSEMTHSEKAKFISEFGQEAYFNLQ